MQHLEHLVSSKDVCEIYEELPENAYYVERGQCELKDVVNHDGIVTLRRFFPDSPSVIAFFTVRDNPINSQSPPRSSLGAAKFSTCYKLHESSFAIKRNAIVIREPQLFLSDNMSVTFRYIAYVKTKPCESSLLLLTKQITQRLPEVEQKIQAWLNEGHYISATNVDDQSMLHIAAQEGNFSVVRWLVDHKADVALADKAGWTPIFCALFSGDLRSAQYIAQHGGIQKEALSSNASNPVHYLAKIIPSNAADSERYLYVLNKCVEVYGAGISQPNNSNETPLHKAALSKNIFLLKHLLELVHVISLDPNLRNWRGHTCLHLAIASGNNELVQFLSSQFMIDIPPFDSPNSPHQMCAVHNPDLASLLPKHGKLRLANLNRYVLLQIFEYIKLDPASCMRCLCVSKDIRQIVLAAAGISACTKFWGKLDELEQKFIQGNRLTKFKPVQYTDGVVRDYDILFKVLVVSDPGVGATTFCNNTVDDIKFSPNDTHYVFAIKRLIVDGLRIKALVWHRPGGGRRFVETDLDREWYRGANACFVIFDPTNKSSVRGLAGWQQEMERYAPVDQLKFFIATKADIQERMQTEEIENLIVPERSDNEVLKALSPIIVESRQDRPEIAVDTLRLAVKMWLLSTHVVAPPIAKKKSFFDFFK